MPAIIQYDQSQVVERPLPSFRQDSVGTPALFTGALESRSRLASAVSDIGTAALEIARKEQERADVDAVFKAEVALKEEYLAFNKHMEDNLRGDAAKDVDKQAREWWGEQGRKHAEKLGNENQRRLFINRTSGLRLQALSHADNFKRTQTAIARDQTYKANLVSEVNIAASAPSDEAVVNARDNILKLNTYQAQAQGWSADFLKGVNAESLTKLHEQVVESLIVKNPDLAQGYFNKYQNEITGSEVRNRLAALAEKANIGVVSVQSAGEIYDPKKGLDVMEEEARKRFLKQPELLKATIANLRERHQATQAGERTRVSDAQAPLTLAVMNGATPEMLSRDPRFQKLSLMGEAGAERAASLMQHAQRRVEHQASLAASAASRAAAEESRAFTREQREQTRLNIRGLDAMWRLSDPQRLASMPRNEVINLAPMIGNDNTQRLLNRHDELTKNGTALREATVDRQAFMSFAERAGLRPFEPNMPENRKQLLNDVQNRLEQIISSEQIAKKRPLTRPEKDEIMQRELNNKVILERFSVFGVPFGQREAPAITLNPSEITPNTTVNVDGRNVRVADVPPQYMARITQQLQAEGKDASLQNVMRVWLANRTRLLTPPGPSQPIRVAP